MSENTLESPDASMCRKWATHLQDRNTIEYFWMWLQENHPKTTVAGTHLQPLLDEYHGIDQRKLDQERQQKLDECKQSKPLVLRPWRRDKFELPTRDAVFPGFTDNASWNGWETPAFTLETCFKIIEEFKFRFVMAGPSLRVWMDDSDDPEDFAPFDIVSEDGERHTVYAMGAYSWCWSLSTPA